LGHNSLIADQDAGEQSAGQQIASGGAVDHLPDRRGMRSIFQFTTTNFRPASARAIPVTSAFGS
jgi:hypothetical protein